jgi:hypothetical protein
MACLLSSFSRSETLSVLLHLRYLLSTPSLVRLGRLCSTRHDCSFYDTMQRPALVESFSFPLFICHCHHTAYLILHHAIRAAMFLWHASTTYVLFVFLMSFLGSWLPGHFLPDGSSSTHKGDAKTVLGARAKQVYDSRVWMHCAYGIKTC